MKNFNTKRLIAILAALCLMTSAFVGSTLAKYVTSDDATDTARVAKWGVSVTAAATQDLFTKTYKAPEGEAVTVSSSTEDDVVAPGTSGTFSNFTISGTPEVATKVTYTPEVTLSNNWKESAEQDAPFYCPIVISVGGTEVAGTKNAKSAEDYKKAVEDAIAAKGAEYAVNTQVQDTLAITWAWAYEGEDVKDTYLGDQAAADNAATILIDVTATVTQVD